MPSWAVLEIGKLRFSGLFATGKGPDPRIFFLFRASLLEFPGILGDYRKTTRQRSHRKIGVMSICSFSCVET
jgi:hypothetical protein